jgi:Flp pilus assembly protein TadG
MTRGARDGPRGWWGDDTGSAPAEFALVGGLLALVVLAVLQLALALYVRTTVLDAASEGARRAALADATPADGAQRTDELLDAALGTGYPRRISVAAGTWHGQDVEVVTVRAALPVAGLFGPDRALEVEGHAALERGP